MVSIHTVISRPRKIQVLELEDVSNPSCDSGKCLRSKQSKATEMNQQTGTGDLKPALNSELPPLLPDKDFFSTNYVYISTSGVDRQRVDSVLILWEFMSHRKL